MLCFGAVGEIYKQAVNYMYFGMDDNPMLFLERLTDSDANELTIIFSKSIMRKPTSEENKAAANGNEALLKILNGTMSIDPDPEQVYKVYFDDYILYQTRNERFCMFDPDEARIGKGLIIYEKSKLLDHLYTFTPFLLEGEDGYPGGVWKHYQIITAQHVVDVVSHREPVIEKIKLGDYNLVV